MIFQSLNNIITPAYAINKCSTSIVLLMTIIINPLSPNGIPLHKCLSGITRLFENGILLVTN